MDWYLKPLPASKNLNLRRERFHKAPSVFCKPSREYIRPQNHGSQPLSTPLDVLLFLCVILVLFSDSSGLPKDHARNLTYCILVVIVGGELVFGYRVRVYFHAPWGVEPLLPLNYYF
jgi:hypothetical protein